MHNYEKLTDNELDLLLSMGYFSRSKAKYSFSLRFEFQDILLPRIRECDLIEEFGKNIVHFLKAEGAGRARLAYEICNCDLKIFKMAALKTYHENKELI